MRSRALSLALLLALALPLAAASAQHAPDRGDGIRLGLAAGLSAARINDGAYSSRLAFNPSAYLGLPFRGPLSLEAGLAYTAKGATYQYSGVRNVMAMDYLEIPLLLRLRVPVAGAVAPFVRAGVALDYQTSCRLVYHELATELRKSCAQYDADNSGGGVPRRRFDVSGIVGAGVGYTVGARHLWIAGQYDHGFRTISPELITKHRVRSIVVGMDWRVR